MRASRWKVSRTYTRFSTGWKATRIWKPSALVGGFFTLVTSEAAVQEMHISKRDYPEKLSDDKKADDGKGGDMDTADRSGSGLRVRSDTPLGTGKKKEKTTGQKGGTSAKQYAGMFAIVIAGLMMPD